MLPPPGQGSICWQDKKRQLLTADRVNEQPPVALGEPRRTLELCVAFITARFAPPLMAQPRPLSASQAHVWVWQQRANSQSCLLHAHTWDSAPSPRHHLGTLACPQLPYLKCTASICASPLHERSARKAGILLTSIPSDSCDQDGLKLIPSVTWAALTCTVAAQRRLREARPALTHRRSTSTLLQPPSCSHRASSLAEPAASPASQRAHPKELFPWPKLHTRHIRNYSNTCPRAVLSPVFPLQETGPSAFHHS